MRISVLELVECKVHLNPTYRGVLHSGTLSVRWAVELEGCGLGLSA